MGNVHPSCKLRRSTCLRERSLETRRGRFRQVEVGTELSVEAMRAESHGRAYVSIGPPKTAPVIEEFGREEKDDDGDSD